VLNCVVSVPVSAAVYHVTADGWKKVRGDDVTECHFEYYPDPAAHPSAGTPVI
jgi:20S proteasome subunit beta 5